MHKRHEMIHSPAMGRKMHVWCYGFFGMPLLVFPSAAGFAHEWDAHGMTTTLAPLIAAGKIKLYCPESNVSQAWTNKADHPSERVKRHLIYEQFILETLVPWIREDCHSSQIPIATVGCSLGGFYAVNFGLKYPEIFNFALGMSGRYAMTHFTQGFSNQDIYFNNPLAYVVGLHGSHLERVQKQARIHLVCGQGAFEEGCIEETIALGQLLDQKGIPNVTDIWGTDSRHDWNWWKKQAVIHLGRVFG